LGPIPLPLGELAQKKWFFEFGVPILRGKLLSIAFLGLRLEATRKSTGVDSLWLDLKWHRRCLMTTGYYAYTVPSSLG